MKGITKAIMRTPHMITSKVGMTKKSSDLEFDEFALKFAALESAAEKLLKDAKAFNDILSTVLMAGEDWATHFNHLFQPVSGETRLDLEGKCSGSAETFRHTGTYIICMSELREDIGPESELIRTRVIAPIKEFQSVLKTIRKCMTKREHKLTDYDRFNNSLTKLRNKKDRSLSDEKHLSKLEAEFDQAVVDYELINNNLKADLPRFFIISRKFIDPLYRSFYYMQLNIYYVMLEKLREFSQGKVRDLASPADIAQAYEDRHTDAREMIENLSINGRMQTTARIIAARHTSSASTSTSQLRTVSQASNASSVRPLAAPSIMSMSTGSVYTATDPHTLVPSPPPYSTPLMGDRQELTGSPTDDVVTPLANPDLATTVKQNPPPSPTPSKRKLPPPVDKKEVHEGDGPKSSVSYVVALFDFEAQADGDLGFKIGDRIEVVERSDNAVDWWTGRLNGREGVFPGNYVGETKQ